jgi:hypothetical protein
VFRSSDFTNGNDALSTTFLSAKMTWFYAGCLNILHNAFNTSIHTDLGAFGSVSILTKVIIYYLPWSWFVKDAFDDGCSKYIRYKSMQGNTLTIGKFIRTYIKSWWCWASSYLGVVSAIIKHNYSKCSMLRISLRSWLNSRIFFWGPIMFIWSK